ncbi:transposase IS4 family protein [Parafrankia sp. EUN1f]|nr:transposase IS4 family protein [Parafrankia sp. EUN1f]
MITDATGVPLASTVTGGNRHDVTQLIPLVEAIPAIRGRAGRPRDRPRYLLADRACDHNRYRRQLSLRQITPVIARRGHPHGSGLGTQRWPVERTICWLHQFRRLRTRWERKADLHQAFLTLACSIICLRKLRESF